MPRLPYRFIERMNRRPHVEGLGAPDAGAAPSVRGKRRLAVVAGAVLLFIGSAVGIDNMMWRGAHAAAVASAVGGAASAVSVAVRDPGAIFAARSPGLRGAGALLNTKAERVAAATRTAPPGSPEERVLASIRERPPETELAFNAPRPPLTGTLPALADGGAPSFVPTGASPLQPAFPPAFPPAFASGPGAVPLSASQPAPPGSDTPGDTPSSGTPPLTTTPAGPPPVSAVPEPAAWMLMSLALFAVGGVLRRERARRPAILSRRVGSNA
jgi:hypothetical protein